MNSDTFAAYLGASAMGSTNPGTSSTATRNRILDQTLASGTETEFVLGQDNAATSIAVLSVPLQTAILGSSAPMDPNVNASLTMDQFGRPGNYRSENRPYFNSGSLDLSRPFTILICGIVIPASNAGNTYDIKVYGGTSKAGTKIADTGAVAVASSTATFGFAMFVQCVWNVGSGNLRGWFQFEADGTTPGHGNQATLSNSFVAAAPANLQFCASQTWGNAVGGVTKVTEFSMSQN
jgi:hypothetical protein